MNLDKIPTLKLDFASPTATITSFAEVDGVLAKGDAYEEARRCLRCYCIYSIVTAKSLKNGNANGYGTGHEQKLTAIAG